MAYICETCRREVLHAENHVCWKAGPNKPVVMIDRTPDLLDALDRAHDLIRDLRRTLDHDEGGLPFSVSHNPDARCGVVRDKDMKLVKRVCHCRLNDTITECSAVEKELADATKALEAAQHQMKRIAEGK